MMRISETVKHLIIINVIMFIGTIAIGEGVLFYDWFALYFPKNEAFQPWQIVTHMFMHGGPMHIFFNMFALWMFGTPVEQTLGSKRFLFIYFSAGLGAVALQLGYYYFKYIPMEQEAMALGFTQEQIVEVFKDGKVFRAIGQEFNEIYYASMVGASGCIMGILVAFGMMNPEAKLMMIFLPIPIKAKYFIPGIIILDLISGITGQSFFSPSNTAYMAHVGGALAGFIIMWYWKKTQFNRNRWN
ncbi:rhomboid family intramembrane serine protease [Flaviramulus sp. BrNp1-15]|uniref:rhomboid family intramembrane serine protease n=1 Tax=Flaviramulus sp. BrNp1-15 TaxID=2916754 RepID=UPI001EE9A1B8|nr:rhomboid family intramembrane serine protease [Flaviramulus sp. BrNp1-15]ULC60320.1 rhomboid family intramembrane serine protease [Flaviramulus sp. BrNp1-15]